MKYNSFKNLKNHHFLSFMCCTTSTPKQTHTTLSICELQT